MAAVALGPVLAACGSSSPSSSTSTTTPGTSVPVASRQAVSGVAQLTAISCPTTTLCEAVGSNSLNGQGVVVTITKGMPGTAHVVAGTKSLLAVSCATPTSCEAVGTGGGHGVIVPITGGTPGSPVLVEDVSTLQTVSCSSATSCQAGGRGADSGAVSVGTLVHPVFATTSVNAVACPDTSCTGVASTSNGKYNDVLLPISSGTPGTIRLVPPGTSTFSAIACSTGVRCVVVGRGVHEARGANSPEAVVLTVNSGAPGRLRGVAHSTSLLLRAVACSPGGNECVAVGTNGSTSTDGAAPQRGAFLPLVGGVPAQLHTVAGPPLELTGVACPTATVCEAVGNAGGNASAVVVTLKGS